MSDASLYDEIPYPGRAFPQTHPDRLATMATLFGLQPVAPGACRVLELGCGDGGNLLPMALALPGSSFVGIDLAPGAIARACSVAEELEIENVRFETIGIEEFDADPGSFDYVIAHGVYSWVDEDVRELLMAGIARVLSERGVAYVSYNALPGHGVRQTLRAMLAFALRGIDEPHERMAAARALLADAGAVWRSGDGLETTMGGQAKMLLNHSDALFFHDTLSPINKALYFREFAAHAGAHGLRFLAEAEFTEMQVGALPEGLRARLDALDDVVEREQLLDFLKQRMFRQTLLCRASATVDHTARPERLATLAAAGAITSAVDVQSGRVTFTSVGGGSLTTDHPLLISALTTIGAHWPGAVWIADLAEEAGDGDVDASGDVEGDRGEPADALAVLGEALLPCFAANLLRLHAVLPGLTITPPQRPRASPLARRQARERQLMTTLRHTSIQLEDDLGWRLVALLDGTRDRAALLDELETVLEGDYPDLAADLDRSLDTLARVGLLMAQEEP
jgi:SAM-dependent methyltransferase